MITQRERVVQRPVRLPAHEQPAPTPEQPSRTTGLERDPRADPAEPGWVWRLLMLVVGFGLVMIGWSLVMSVFLIFIGLPVFIFGLALMQAQER